MIRGKEGCSWLIASISFIKYAAWCSVESEENARVRKRRPAEQGHVEGLLESCMGPWRLQKVYEFRCGKCTAQGLAINGRDCSCSLSVLRECIQGLTNLQETKSWMGAVMGLKANQSHMGSWRQMSTEKNCFLSSSYNALQHLVIEIWEEEALVLQNKEKLQIQGLRYNSRGRNTWVSAGRLTLLLHCLQIKKD